MIMPWTRLSQLGIMGINQRNADFIMPYNSRSRYPLVDDKKTTKRLAMEAGIAVPELYGVIEIVRQISDLDTILGDRQDFVIKPAHGSGGEGILIINGRYKGSFRKSSGILLSSAEMVHHIENIISGMYSLGGLPDTALIEYCVKFDRVFDPVSYQGVPDIRTLVFRGVPVLAMVRLPTRLSDGKANLHQGAIGVGINLDTGLTRRGVFMSEVIEYHPDTGAAIEGLQIPHWETILHLSTQCADIVQLGYIGVDIVLDRELGPLVLELNARPGLGIQIANNIGLLTRLNQVQALAEIPESVEDRVILAKQLLS